MTQSHIRFLDVLRLDEVELRSRRAFYEITDDDLARLASLAPLMEKSSDKIVDGFYQLLLGHPETRAFLQDPALVTRLKKLQRDYFMALFAGKLDMSYVADRLRVGAAHERIGLAPKWYIGAYRRYLQLVHEVLFAELAEGEAKKAYASVLKLVSFDKALAIDTYIAANLETLGRHQAAIRELSTPVIRVHESILLLPIIGAIDSLRAQQIMESVLTRVVEEQARVLIIDIAGVPVVDTKVADNLIKTTAAVTLLGAQSILTGISAQVARTIIQLGLDMSSVKTLNKLADGVEHALTIIGKTVSDKKV
jgi:rsbT co-antagonist protein RsbR